MVNLLPGLIIFDVNLGELSWLLKKTVNFL